MSLVWLETLNSTTADNGTSLTNLTSTEINFINGEKTVELSVSTIFWAAINGILFIAIICGNTLTIIAIRTCRRLKSMISNLFILSLAVSDLIVGLVLPYHLAFYLGSDLGKSHQLCLIRFFFIIFACCVSILTLIAIAIDRYIAIVYALHYRRFMTRRVALIIISLSWITGATVAAIPMFWNHWNTASECEFDEILPAMYMAGIITPGFIIIWIFMLLVYWRIMREASKHARQMRYSTTNSCGQQIRTHSDWKSVQVVFFIMGCFSICWLPYFIVACAQIFDIYRTTPILYKGAFSLAMTNSGLNPIIYSWKNSNFRQAFSLLLRCKSPNSHHNNDDAIYSIRSHHMTRQPSSNSMIVLAISPLTCLPELPVQAAETVRTRPTSLPTTRNIFTNTELSSTAAASTRVVIADEECASVTGIETACGPCALCKNLLRKSTRMKNNISKRPNVREINIHKSMTKNNILYEHNNNNNTKPNSDKGGNSQMVFICDHNYSNNLNLIRSKSMSSAPELSLRKT